MCRVEPDTRWRISPRRSVGVVSGRPRCWERPVGGGARFLVCLGGRPTADGWPAGRDGPSAPERPAIGARAAGQRRQPSENQRPTTPAAAHCLSSTSRCLPSISDRLLCTSYYPTSTMHYPPATVNHTPSAIHPPATTVPCASPAIHYPSSTTHCLPFTIDRLPLTTYHPYHPAYTIHYRPSTVHSPAPSTLHSPSSTPDCPLSTDHVSPFLPSPSLADPETSSL